MSEKTRPIREERLRAILREGDPARIEPVPTSEEVRRMRRMVLAALPPAGEPRRRAFWIPVMATAAAAALTLALALGLWRAHTGSTVRAPELGQQANAVPEPSEPEKVAAAPIAVPAPEAEPPRVETPRPPRPRRAVRPAAPPSAPEERAEALAVEQAGSLPPEEPTPRQVQFAAPGGTRVIWMLSTESVVEELSE